MTIPDMQMLYEARISQLKKKSEAEIAARRLEQQMRRR